MPADAYTTTDALIERLTDIQLEVAGLRPNRDNRPAVVSYNATGAGALAASASAMWSFPVNGKDPFVARQLRLWSTGPLLINIRVSTYADALSYTGPLHSVAAFGPAANPEPLILDRPWLIPETATVFLDVQNLTAAINEVAFLMVGYRAQ